MLAYALLLALDIGLADVEPAAVAVYMDMVSHPFDLCIAVAAQAAAVGVVVVLVVAQTAQCGSPAGS